MDNQKFPCPMCHKEGTISVRTFQDENPHLRLLGYAAVIGVIFAGGSLLLHLTNPRTPTPMEQCAKSCGTNRFKAYTLPTEHWTEHVQGTAPNIEHPPVPEKCECVVRGENAEENNVPSSPKGPPDKTSL